MYEVLAVIKMLMVLREEYTLDLWFKVYPGTRRSCKTLSLKCLSPDGIQNHISDFVKFYLSCSISWKSNALHAFTQQLDFMSWLIWVFWEPFFDLSNIFLNDSSQTVICYTSNQFRGTPCYLHRSLIYKMSIWGRWPFVGYLIQKLKEATSESVCETKHNSS